MVKREITKKLIQLSEKFPVVVVVGPRQSGKTTLVKATFPKKEYVNLEEPDTRLFAQNDPRAFLADRKYGIIIDEAQRVPDIFSYIQSIVDSNPLPGKFILTGSNNFLMHEKISQTLAGRAAILTLLPFSLNEIFSTNLLNLSTDRKKQVSKELDFYDFIFNGFYPPIYDRKIDPIDWYPNYTRTYIERDVRLIKNIPDLNSFTLFVKLCAGRVGQLLNLSSLSNEVGVSVNTIKSWLSVLEASYIIFRLEPHYENFNKRLVKMPKIYFYDTGLLCSLIGLENANQLKTHYLLGSLFENFIISELLKYRMNYGLNFNITFWRDKLGREIDCIIDTGMKRIILEIKAAKTIADDFFKSLLFYKELSAKKNLDAFLIYGGNKNEARSFVKVLSWNNMLKIF